MANAPSLELADLEAIPLVNDAPSRQFVMQVGAYRARLEYDHQGDRIFLTHTEVPPQLQGHHVADVMTEKALTWIEEHKLKLVPLCPFTKAYLRRHTAWKRLLVKGLYV